MKIKRKCSTQKMVSTSIRASTLSYSAMGTWRGCVKFLSDYIEYQPPDKTFTMVSGNDFMLWSGVCLFLDDRLIVRSSDKYINTILRSYWTQEFFSNVQQWNYFVFISRSWKLRSLTLIRYRFDSDCFVFKEQNETEWITRREISMRM